MILLDMKKGTACERAALLSPSLYNALVILNEAALARLG